MNQLIRNLACEWAKDGIRTNGVAPWCVPAFPCTHSAASAAVRSRAFGMRGPVAF